MSRTTTVRGEEYRLASFQDADHELIVGRRLSTVTSDLSRFRDAFLAASPAALLLAFAASAFIARRALRPVRLVTASASSLTIDALDRRIEASVDDAEFAALVAMYNQMLDRLQRSFEDTRRFAGLAAHELKTPLTILRGKLDLAIQAEEPGSPRQQFLSELLHEVGRLKGVVDKLLLLVKADAGHLELQLGEVDISRLLAELAEDTEILAPHLEVTASVLPNQVVEGDRSLLIQAVYNLLSNAMKYNRTSSGGFIRVRLLTTPNGLEIHVANSAHPIPPEMHEAIFSRFERGTTRARRKEGAGLGLSLARDIARAHGGDLVLAESSDQQTLFILRLPRVACPPASVRTSRRFPGEFGSTCS